MNYVIAKVRKEDEFKKVYSGAALYKMPDNVDGAVKYDVSTNLEDGDWFKIENFSKQDYCLEFLKDEFRTTDYTMISKVNAELMEYICAYENEKYFFQRILKNNILAKKYLCIGDNVELREGKNIVINEWPDAVYCKDSDILYFRRLQTITPIFKGIEILYKEATQAETEEFLDNDFIKPTNNYSADKVKTLNRKRIAVAMETLKGLNKKQRKEVFDYTHKYYPQLNYSDHTFEIGNEEEMKYLLWGIEQRYYTTPVTKENRVANSIIPLNF